MIKDFEKHTNKRHQRKMLRLRNSFKSTFTDFKSSRMNKSVDLPKFLNTQSRMSAGEEDPALTVAGAGASV